MHAHFHDKIAILAMRAGKLSVPRIAQLMLKLGENREKKVTSDRIRQALKMVKGVIETYTLVDGMLLSKSCYGVHWILESGDRTKVLSESFLETCAPDWAKELRDTIARLEKR